MDLGPIIEFVGIILAEIFLAIIIMIVDAFFGGLLWRRISFRVKKLKLRSAKNIKMEMRRSIEITIPDIKSEESGIEIERVRKKILSACQKTFDDCDLVGETIIEAKAKDQKTIEIEFDFDDVSDESENEIHDMILRIVMTAKSSSSYPELAKKLFGLWTQIDRMNNVISSLRYSSEARAGKASVNIELNEPPVIITELSRFKISDFRSDFGSFVVDVNGSGITFNGEFTDQTVKILEDFVAWIYV